MSTLTSKGQVTVPIEIRRRLALDTGDRLRWTVRADGVVELARADSHEISEVAGMLRARAPRGRAKTVADMDRGIAQAVTARDEASRRVRRR